MKTKIFCDIADFKTIKFFNKKSIVDGFTTNPSLMRLAGAKNYKDYSLKILKVCKKKPISFEVFADEPKEMLKQAYKINAWGKNVYVKIPVVNSKGLFMGSVIKNIEILWASTREAYNYIQAKQLKCNIITMPPKVINQINSFGKSFQSMTTDTVKGFLKDSVKSKFKL